MGSGAPSLATNQKRTASGSPFTPGSANNGLSVDAGTGKIVLGNDTGGILANLFSDREINQGIFSLSLNTNIAGAAAGGGLVLNPTFNTSGAPTAFKLSLTNTASAAAANLVDIGTVGLIGSRLLIPVNTAKVVFTANGLQVQGTSAGPGGMTFNGTLPGGNNFVVGSGFLMNNSTGLVAPNVDAFTFSAGTGAQIDVPSGTMATIMLRGDFGPTSGNAIGSIVTVAGTINQTGGANGVTRGLWVNPGVVSATDFRAFEVNGGIHFNDATAMLFSHVAMNNGAGASAGTLLNAPAAGNPSKWIPFNDNGTIRYMPAW